MRILITNDDGINAPGILKLVHMAMKLGEVWVVAPEKQCSAMSQRIHVRTPLRVREVKLPDTDDHVHAFSLDGTPAECVKVAMNYIMKEEKADIVFSGINSGYNAGFDIAYSGTVCAAIEAVMQGSKAIAFSTDYIGEYEVVDAFLDEVTRELIGKMDELQYGELYNVNFPGIKLSEYKGILRDRKIAQTQYVLDNLKKTEDKEDGYILMGVNKFVEETLEGSDIKAIRDGFISIGKVRSFVMM